VAQSLAWALGKPAVAIHHLEGHLLSPLLAEPAPDFPFLALLVSGGHTQLMQVDGVGRYTLLGETLDDAAGEAFDKTAKLLGLSYPGGAALSRLAEQGRPDAYGLPRPMLHSVDLDMSFSGLKTAVLTQVRRLEKAQGHITAAQKADLAAATQAAIVDVLAGKAIKAIRQTGLKQLVVAGGVGANQHLRQRLHAEMSRQNGQVFFPPLEFCTDNGAMIAFAAARRLRAGLVNLDEARSHAFSVQPRWPLEAVSIA